MNDGDEKQDSIQEILIMASIMKKIRKTCGTAFKKNSSIRMNILPYLKRIYQFSECHKNCFIMALILIDRVMEQYMKSKINLPFSIHTLSLASLVVCMKMTEDDPPNN